MTPANLAAERYGITCTLAYSGRGDCEHAVGYPSPFHRPGIHDGPDDTVDEYGKPNGWCWSCWRSRQIVDFNNQVKGLQFAIHSLKEAGGLNSPMPRAYPTTTDPVDWSIAFYNKTKNRIFSRAELQDWFAAAMQAMHDHLAPLQSKDWVDLKVFEAERDRDIAKARVKELEDRRDITSFYHELPLCLEARANDWRNKAMRTQDPIRIDINNLIAVHCEELAEDLREVLK